MRSVVQGLREDSLSLDVLGDPTLVLTGGVSRAVSLPPLIRVCTRSG